MLKKNQALVTVMEKESALKINSYFDNVENEVKKYKI